MRNQEIMRIEERMSSLGTEYGKMYTNSEIMEKLMELQDVMTEEMMKASGCQQTPSKMIMMTMDALAKQNGFQDESFYTRYKSGMDKLGFSVAGILKGMKGERDCQKALSYLQRDPGVEILYNVALPDESRSEIDALVLAPYGIIIVEVKNWSGDIHITERGVIKKTLRDGSTKAYGIGERLEAKEYTLRKYIDNYDSYQHGKYILFMDGSATITDDYKQIPVSYRNTIVRMVRQNKDTLNEAHAKLSVEDIQRIKELVEDKNEPQTYYCTVNCDQLKEDFLRIMERFYEPEQEEHIEIPKQVTPVVKKSRSPRYDTRSLRTRRKLRTVLQTVAATAVTLACATAGMKTDLRM